MKRLIRLPVRLVIGLALFAVVLSLLVARNNAAALSTVDTTHVNVGAVVWRGYITGRFNRWCSGILIAPQVLLTAGHCTEYLQYGLDAGYARDIWVTFDTQVTQSSSFVAVTDLITNPDYHGVTGNLGSDPHDLGVVLLATPVALPPAALPTENLLDSLHLRPDTPVTAVGYGFVSNDVRSYNSPFYDQDYLGQTRHSGIVSYRSLLPAFITLTQLSNQGNDNFCNGDSGGPGFVQVNGQEQLVALVDTGATWSCETVGWMYRVDTPQARAFLGQYVTLP